MIPTANVQSDSSVPAAPRGVLPRRRLLAAGGAALAGLTATWAAREALRSRHGVFLARNQRYEGPLARTIGEGLAAVGLDLASLRGKRVLLKPNLVEPAREAPHIVTHPAVVLAAAEAFQRLGAQVTVGEAPGHMRDTEQILDASGLGEALAEAGIPFRDLNYESFGFVRNAFGASPLEGFYFPQDVLEADLVVSLPKLKTHHWVGLTCALKNLYGTLPGCKYGWPKNVLHYAGIPQTVVDIAASLPKTIAIVDGIVGMEGDGPILGSPKPLGVLAIGLNPLAVDATCARLIGLVPERIPYLELGHGRLGRLGARSIEQRGEPWEELRTPFALLDAPHLAGFRAP